MTMAARPNRDHALTAAAGEMIHVKRSLSAAERAAIAQAFGRRVLELRMTAGFSQEELAERCERVSLRRLERIESGEDHAVDFALELELARALGVTADVLVRGMVVCLPRPPRRFRSETYTAVADLYNKGATRAEIARRLKLKPHEVHKMLNVMFAAGMPKRPKHELTDGDIQAIYAAYRDGGAIAKLAKERGFTASAIYRQFRRRGLPLLPRQCGKSRREDA